MSDHHVPPPRPGDPDGATDASPAAARQVAGDGPGGRVAGGRAGPDAAVHRSPGLRARLASWQGADGWAGLWPASARADRSGWLFRELALLALAILGMVGSIAVAAGNQSEGMELDAVSGVLLGLGVVALPFRHRYPAAALAVAFTTTLAYTTFYAQGPLFLPLIVTFGEVVLLGRRWLAVATAVTGFVLFSWLGVVVGEDDAPTVGQVVGLAAWLAFLLSLSEIIRARRDRAREEARSHAEALRRRATEERLRIARELHDVVAHNMSLISIQAGVALHLMDQRPEQARESLATIKQASKEALVELRSILGVLRQVDEDDEDDLPGGLARPDLPGSDDGGPAADRSRPGADAPRSPVPGLERLDELVERARAAGIAVRVTGDHDLVGLPRDVDLAAYRIIQESLTNAARHAGGTEAEVRIRRGGGALSVDVLDEGSGARLVPTAAKAGAPGGGHGIAGMRERAASVGGSLEAGPRPGRGFAVRARLPLEEAAE